MQTFIYSSATKSVAANKQRFERILTPMLKDILDDGVEFEIDIDKQNNLCINQIPIGNFELISNFRTVYSESLTFDYSGRTRTIDFEEIYDFFKPPRKREIQAIFELQPSGALKKLYQKD